jgi:F1F0 ATPase subunit 2
MMNDMLTLLLAWVMGGLLGAVFFGGLWWTVRKSVTSERPVLWTFGSLLLRMGMTVAGFYLVSGGHWERLLLCLLGFIMVRLVVTRLVRSSGENRIRPHQEAGDAP